MTQEQHWDHCIITFMGENWLITHVKPGRIIGIRWTGRGYFQTIIDTSKINWDHYCNEAVRFINARQKETPVK